jgi:DNA polymerase III alpha subunit
MPRELYEFPCGCKWPVAGPPPSPGALPLVDIDENNLPFCKAAFAVMARGDTKGVFQLESSLGRHWSKKLGPTTEEHVAALGALLRPGCLKAVDEDGHSMTEKYCLRKNGEQEVTSYHPALEPILADTYQVICYQEQLMRMGKELAGFDLIQVDKLRKAVGKKDQQELAKVREMFLAGCSKLGVVTDEQAATVWGWMEKSGRYLFNKAHAMSYALVGYDTAYAKSHIPVAFYANWLYYAEHKADPREENAELVRDAKLFDVEIGPPDMRDLEASTVEWVDRSVGRWYDRNGRFITECLLRERPEGGADYEPTGVVSHEEVFSLCTDGVSVRFGLKNVKGVGANQVVKLFRAYQAARAALKRPLSEWSWEEWLFHCGDATNTPAVAGWIAVGAFRWTRKSRARLAKEFAAWCELTDKEKEWARANLSPSLGLPLVLRALGKTKKEGGGCSTAKRADLVRSQADLLDNHASTDDDHPNTVAGDEETYLGVALSCTRVEGCDASMVNCSCKEFLSGRAGRVALGVEVKEVRKVKTKRGKNPGQTMAFLSVEDGSAGLADVVAFSDVWEESGRLLYRGNTVLLEGQRDQKKGGFIVNRVYQL